MYDNSYIGLGTDNLIESDLTSYEFFCALPSKLQKRIKLRDFCSFSEMSNYVSQLRASH